MRLITGMKLLGWIKRTGPVAGLGRTVFAPLWGRRLRPLWVTATILLVLFTIFRIGLLLARFDKLAGVRSDEISRCFGTGARYDLMPIGYGLLPLAVALSLVPAAAFRRPRFRKAISLYAASLVTFALAIKIIGAAFFLHYGKRLNFMFFAYVANPEIWVFIWNEYPLLVLVPLPVVVLYVCYRLFAWCFDRGPWPRDGEWVLVRLARTAVLAGLCVLACRGGVERQPLRRDSAYISMNLLVDQLTMNDFFTVFHAARSTLTEGRDEKTLYRFPSLANAARISSSMLTQEADTPLSRPENPLWRRTRNAAQLLDCNVVIIVMEGMAGRAVGALGYSPGHTPSLDALCRDGLFFERMYAVGARTSRGMVGVLCGHPDLGGVSVLLRERAQGKFLTLPSIFRDRGYETIFIYGGDPEFDNMADFFTAGGIAEIIGQEQMNGKAGNWGVHDEVIFRRAHEKFEELGDRRFFAVVLTVSNHEPYEVPPAPVEMLPAGRRDRRNKMLNAYRYSDWALGEFFRLARGAPYFQNTIFVLVADHGRELDQTSILDVPAFRIPCLIYAPGIVPPDRIAAVASQTDIAPTLLGLLGGQYEHCFMGRNMFTVREGDGFALLHEDVHLAFVRGDRALVLPPGPKSRPILFRLGPFAMERVPPGRIGPAEVFPLKQQMLSYYMMARHLYLTGAYCGPARYAAVAPGT